MFEKKPSVNEFNYFFIVSQDSKLSDFVKENLILPAIGYVKENYGICFEEVNYLKIPKLKEGIVPYILYGPIDPLNLSKKEKDYIKELGKLKDSKVNTISAYTLIKGKDSKQYLENAEEKVLEISKDLNINVIFPDEIYEKENLRSVDLGDIKDNIICETIRAKYNPVNLNNKEEPKINEHIKKEIKNLRRIFKDFHLWHRDKTDGAVMIIDNEFCIVSQTKTDKTKLIEEDFSLVKGFNRDKKDIKYIGKKIPSSDSPEFLFLNELMDKKIRLLVHFHKNEITRGRKFSDHITEDKIEYGQFDSGKEIYEEFKKQKENWIILKEHGVLWVGENTKEFEKFIFGILRSTIPQKTTFS